MLILSGKVALQKNCSNIIAFEKVLKVYCAERRADYDTCLLYYDVPNKFKIRPVRKSAKAIRKFILDVEKKWGIINILLIIGGDAVVPFFRLTNPCDDSDAWVLSDNPYASRDDDFLIPERICARIPDNKDTDFIIKLLQKKSGHRTRKAFGLTARMWEKASENVYRQIGKVKDLKVSPPVTSDFIKAVWLNDKDYLYFNVHGSNESANWYGQDGDEYPIALKPDNVVNAGGVVASEACYGAYIIKKSDKNAISLKFLNQNDVLCFCGSTTIAYGPATPPSSEADLLVKYFFEYVKQGVAIGESLKNAKSDIARKSIRRHGFLDDDDQKTLLQFVLYGDPTIRLNTK